MNQNKRWCIGFAGIVLITLVLIGILTIVVDPYFHYHKPLETLEYPLNSERQRYINDGIIRNFEYDAIIIGSSMTENFKTSQLDELFGVNSVKACYMGTTYYEIANNIQNAIDNHEEIKMVLTSLDVTRLCDESDAVRDDMGTYPSYLYDGNYLNDVQYILNKDVLLEDTYGAINHTLDGKETTSFDEYSNWMQYSVFGKEAVLASYVRTEPAEANPEAMEEQQARIHDNITENVISVASENPETQFYVFFPPYSICFWDDMSRRGLVGWQTENIKIATGLLLECENIHVYAFYEETDIVCDLNNYKDIAHYSENINEQILAWMASGEHELTKENAEQYFDDMEKFYTNYDYDSLFQ